MIAASTLQSSQPDFCRVDSPRWQDKPVAIIGNGASLTGFDFERLRGKFYVLAVKTLIFDIPWADAGFGLDAPRYVEWRSQIIDANIGFPVYWAIPKMKWAIKLGEHAPCMRFIRRVDLSELSTDPTTINSGGSSGFGALNLATLKNARRIVLLGFDYGGDKGSRDRSHYIEPREQRATQWHAWAANFHKVKDQVAMAGITVINASPESRIVTWPRLPIDEALEAIHG